MPTSGYLSQSLRRPLPTKDDGILRTVADVAGYMMALSQDRQRAHWQRAARLLLEEAHAHDLSRQVELALFYDRQLDFRREFYNACVRSILPLRQLYEL